MDFDGVQKNWIAIFHSDELLLEEVEVSGAEDPSGDYHFQVGVTSEADFTLSEDQIPSIECWRVYVLISNEWFARIQVKCHRFWFCTQTAGSNSEYLGFFGSRDDNKVIYLLKRKIIWEIFVELIILIEEGSFNGFGLHEVAKKACQNFSLFGGSFEDWGYHQWNALSVWFFIVFDVLKQGFKWVFNSWRIKEVIDYSSQLVELDFS